MTVPEGSKVKVSEKGDVDVRVPGKGLGIRDSGLVKNEAARPPAPNPQSPPPPLAVAPLGSAQAKQHQENWAKHLGVPVVETNSIGMELRKS